MKKILLSVVLMVSVFAQADLAQVEANYKKCSDDAMSTLDTNQCSAVAYSAADVELNKVYQSLRTQNNADEENSTELNKRLVNAQRAWITLRDADCILEGSNMLGGTGEGMITGGCLASRTIERVKFLQTFLSK